MESCDAHPARRKGEMNFSDPGRDWGKAPHIVPGRRVNEPNHKVWNSPVALFAQTRSGLGMLEDGPKAGADNRDPKDVYEEMALAMVQTIGNSVSILQSLTGMMPVLERMLAARDGEGIHEEGRRVSPATSPNADQEKSDPAGLCWSSDMMVEIHNLCAQNRQSCPTDPKTCNHYSTDHEPLNDILPPLRRSPRK
jgi:hypothetical protein